MTNDIDNLFKKLYSHAIRNTLIVGSILALIWGMLNALIPEGGGQIATNIGFFILSLLFFWLPLEHFLKMKLPYWLAFILATVLWFVIFGGIRSIILTLLD